MFDLAGNVQPFVVTIVIALVNDNAPVILLAGSERDFSTVFNESQPYLGGPEPVSLSADLVITDADVGLQFIVHARVEVTAGRSGEWGGVRV